MFLFGEEELTDLHFLNVLHNLIVPLQALVVHSQVSALSEQYHCGKTTYKCLFCPAPSSHVHFQLTSACSQSISLTKMLHRYDWFNFPSLMCTCDFYWVEVGFPRS